MTVAARSLAILTPALLSVVPTQRGVSDCPADCSFHGVCIRNVCVCDHGWDGNDCSSPIRRGVSFGVDALYPINGLASGGTVIWLRGFNFANTSDLICRFAAHSSSAAPLQVSATFYNSTHVSCTAPPSALSALSGNMRRPSNRALTPEELTPALHTPDMEYSVEIAQPPPYFTNNGSLVPLAPASPTQPTLPHAPGHHLLRAHRVSVLST
jgi:hypothetical protein